MKTKLGIIIMLLCVIIFFGCTGDDAAGKNIETQTQAAGNNGSEQEHLDAKEENDKPDESGVPGIALVLWEPETKVGVGFFADYGLDSETEYQIVKALWVDRYVNSNEDDSAKQIWDNGIKNGKTMHNYERVHCYYGTYNDFVIFRRGGTPTVAVSGIIILLFGDIRLGVRPYHSLSVWKDGNFHDIEELYEQGLLTRDDIIMISESEVSKDDAYLQILN